MVSRSFPLPSSTPSRKYRYNLLCILWMFSILEKCAVHVCVCLCVNISFFSYTNGIIWYSVYCLFALGSVGDNRSILITVPFQYILLNGCIIWKSSPISPSSECWVPSPVPPQTCRWLWPWLLPLPMALWEVSNTQQVPGPMGFVKMTVPFSLILPYSRTSWGYWSGRMLML